MFPSLTSSIVFLLLLRWNCKDNKTSLSDIWYCVNSRKNWCI